MNREPKGKVLELREQPVQSPGAGASFLRSSGALCRWGAKGRGLGRARGPLGLVPATSPSASS